ncbi:MAG: hypothetical protein M3Y87_28705 [Myxococcota bacterium]|nr:hypothetical protein [Myxococcota bacterium]
MSSPAPPAWKWWHPVRFWQVVLIFLVAQLIPTLLFVALREGLGMPIPHWPASGIGGAAGVLVVYQLALKKKRDGIG